MSTGRLDSTRFTGPEVSSQEIRFNDNDVLHKCVKMSAHTVFLTSYQTVHLLVPESGPHTLITVNLAP